MTSFAISNRSHTSRAMAHAMAEALAMKLLQRRCCGVGIVCGSFFIQRSRREETAEAKGEATEQQVAVAMQRRRQAWAYEKEKSEVAMWEACGPRVDKHG